MTEKLPIKARIKRARENSVLNSGHWFVVHDHLCEEGVTLDDLVNHGYWIDIAHKFGVGHEIKVLAEDLSFRALLLVENFQANVGAKVAVLEFHDLSQARRNTEDLPSNTQGLEIKWRGARKWSIVNAQGAVVKQDIVTREEAEKELRSHAKALAA